MAVEILSDQVSTKECAGHGDRTRGGGGGRGGFWGALACQADTLPIELPRPAVLLFDYHDYY